MALGIGERLRTTREARGLTLQAAEGLTRIRAAYLQALEEERFDALPGPVYARGFLRAYAVALGLEPDGLLEAYPADLQPPAQPIIGATPADVPIRPAAARSPARRIVTITVMLLIAAILAVGAFLYLQLQQLAEPVPPRLVAPPPPAAEPSAPAPVTQAAPPRSQAPTAPAPARPSPAGRLTAEVRASGRSWLRVSADGERVFVGFIRTGEVRTWGAQRSLTIRVGNAPVVQVLINGRLVQPRSPNRVWEQTFTAP